MYLLYAKQYLVTTELRMWKKGTRNFLKLSSVQKVKYLPTGSIW